jgi:hypothetical protein
MEKGDVAERAEGAIGEADLERVGFQDADPRLLGESPAEPLSEVGIELDREDMGAAVRQRLGQATASRADLEDEIGRADAGLLDELSR